MTWAVYMGDVPIMWAPFRGGERPRGGEAGPPGVWHGTRLTLHVGSIKLGSTTEEYSGTHRYWIKLMAQRQPRKEYVIHSLLESLRQTVEKKTKTNETG